MGLSYSLFSWQLVEYMSEVFGLAESKDVLVRSISFGEEDIKMALRSLSFKQSNSSKKIVRNASRKTVLGKALSFNSWEPEELKHDTTSLLTKQDTNEGKWEPTLPKSPKKAAAPDQLPQCTPKFFPPRPQRELDAAATKLQKFYKSYRTRRNLADCAVLVEELWWKALDFASLERSSVSFFKVKKQETAISRWARARTRAAKVGKGLLKDEKAQKLALQHWLEAIDPRHRYGHNLHYYYDVWFESESSQPFFYWLDVGDGREINLDKCPRSRLQNQCIKYLGPKEREEYEVIVKNGKLVYKQSELPVSTTEGSKWIFVLSTSRELYIGQKKKGSFQHSSFLAGGATTSAGRLVAEEGVLKAIWPYSGHYLPTEENFKEFIIFLQDNNVDLSNVKRCSVDDDEYPSFKKSAYEAEVVAKKAVVSEVVLTPVLEVTEAAQTPAEGTNEEDERVTSDHFSKRRLSCKWTSATGARIGCVRDYPVDLQSRALEQVNLSPRVAPPSPSGSKVVPIPSPRPSPKVRLSPRLQCMGIPSPKVSLTLPKNRRRRLSDR
ncbi:IQ domain-containing protein IQM1 [Canna indica]|uniref:IQ domain-containing protein IQM1 n=1 Tax=Canna indica TaxID=4628 RepID=A0AAQ3QTA9_9LILI|nr:IQ domain-containing protein IQM1 [Canna indica]